MEGVLKFLASASIDDIFIIDDAVKKRFHQLDREREERLKQSEESERSALWEQWKESVRCHMMRGMEKRDAIHAAFESLKNQWIQRDGEIECPNCGNEYDECYECLFDKNTQVCSDCTEWVKLDHVFDELSDEIRMEKVAKVSEPLSP